MVQQEHQTDVHQKKMGKRITTRTKEVRIVRVCGIMALQETAWRLPKRSRNVSLMMMTVPSMGQFVSGANVTKISMVTIFGPAVPSIRTPHTLLKQLTIPSMTNCRL